MDEKKNQEALNTLHGTHALALKICWSMDEKYSMEDIEKIHKEISDIKGNILNFLSDRDYLIEIVGLYHGLTLKNVEDNYNLSNDLESTQNALQKSMVQIEQLQNRSQGSLTPSYIWNIHPMDEIIYVTKEEPHVMVEDEVHVDMQVLKRLHSNTKETKHLFLFRGIMSCLLVRVAQPWRRQMISQKMDQPIMDNMHSKFW